MVQIPDTWKTKSGRVVTLGSDQKEGVEFLLKHRHSLLSFGTGLGKTLTSVTAGRLILDHIPDTILIIVCPVKAKKAWKKEILDTTQFPSSELAIYSSNESKAYTSKTRILLCTNTNLNKLRGITNELEEKTVCLMVDEAHMLQDTKSQYYKRLQGLRDRAYGDDGGLKSLAEKYHLTGISTKEEALLSTLKMTQDRGYSTIIYADYTDTIDRLESLLSDRIGGKVWKITGSINIRDREKIEDEIQPKDVVLITSAGTESINLQKCNCIIFYDISFSVKIKKLFEHQYIHEWMVAHHSADFLPT